MFRFLFPPRIFYGWWIVAAAFLIALYVGGVVFYGFTAVFEPIAEEFGWSYAQVSIGASIRGLEVGLLAPLIGMLVDRWGPRRLLLIGALATAAGLFLLSQVTSLLMFYGAFLLIAIGMSNCTMTVLMTAVANWFHERVGTASGIAVCGFGFGGLLVPVIVKLVDSLDWRSALVILAIGALVIIGPLSLVFRHRPEHYGHLPDGKAATPDSKEAQEQGEKEEEPQIGPREALRSGTFWRLVLPFSYHVMTTHAIVTHVMPYLSSINVPRDASSLVATGIPLMSIAGRAGLGWLADRFERRKVCAVAYAMMGLGTLWFATVPDVGPWALILFLLFFGVGYGGNNALRPSLTRQFFGRKTFGSIFGFIIGINMLGGMVGPPVAGWVFDRWGHYEPIWFVLAGLALVAMVSVLSLPHVRKAVRGAGADDLV